MSASFQTSFLVALLLLPGPLTKQASASVGLSLGSGSAPQGSTVIIPLTVTNFSQIVTFQFSVQWDQTVLQFAGTGDYALPGLSTSSFASSQPGKLAVSWDDADFTGKSLSDGSKLFSIQLTVLGSSGASSAIVISNMPTSIEFTDPNANTIPVNSQPGTVTVRKQSPVLTWTNPPAISYGTALSSSQLNATANVPGTFAYNPSAGAILSAGSQQTLNVTFTPTDSSSYNVATASVFIDITKATQTITFASLPGKVFGDAPFNLNAVASSGLGVTFNIVSGPASLNGSVLSMTGAGTVDVRASQSGNGDYNAAVNVDQTFIVLPRTPVIAWANPNSIVYGTALGNNQLNATADVPGTFAYNPSAGAILSAGSQQTLNVTFTPTDSSSYNVATASVFIDITKATQTITFASLPGKVFGDAPFNLNATANSGLGVTFSIVSGPASLNGSTLSITGAGTVVVRASLSGNGNYQAASDVDRTFTVAKASQTISFAPLANQVFGASPLGINATASSGLAVSFSVLSGPASLSGNTVSLTGAGTVTIRAAQSGNANYDAAVNVDQAFIVSPRTPVIAWANPNSIVYGTALGNNQLNATADVPGTFAYSPGAGAILAAGSQQTLNVTFTPTDSSSYNTATSSVLIDVAKATQTITFASLPGKVFGDAPFNLNATANSGLGVTFSIVSGPASLNGSTLSITGAGTVVVRASQSGNGNYNGAANVDQTFIVLPRTPVITWTNPNSIVYGTALGNNQLNATADVPGTFAYSPGAGAILAAGSQQTLNVTFTPTDSSSYNTATSSVLIDVAKATQTITFASLPGKVFGDAPFNLNATANSGLGVTFSIVSGPASLNGSTLSITGAGTLVVRASQSGNGTYNAAANVDQTFIVSPRTPVITWANPNSVVYGTPLGNDQLNATADVPGVFTYAPPAGTIVPAGVQTLQATFTPTGDSISLGVALTTIRVLPVVQISPTNQTIGANSTTAFAATVAGTTNVTYQWRLDGAPISNATNQTLTLLNAPSSAAGNYSVLVVNDAGTVVSSDAVLNVVVGFEADVVPRGHPNGVLTIADWVQVGRFAASLDTVSGPEEFMRADCAPRSTLGNGALTIADWVQAGRYAAALDPLTSVGGPSGPVLGGAGGVLPAGKLTALDLRIPPVPRQIKANDITRYSGQIGPVTVTLESAGDENALGFSLSFDPSILVFANARLGLDADSGFLLLNTNFASTGRIGVAVSLNPGATFAAGQQQIVEIDFQAQTFPEPILAQITFGDQVVKRELASVEAVEIPANFSDGSVTVLPNNSGETTPHLSVLRKSRTGSLTLSFTGLTAGTTYILEASTDLIEWIPVQSIIATAPAEERDSTTGNRPHATYFRLRTGAP